MFQKYIFLIAFLLSQFAVHAQLKPGFDADEYLEMLRISSAQSSFKSLPQPLDYQLVYRSPEVGLDNLWTLWINKENNIMVVCLRGTTAKTESWLENFYAAMIPATGTLKVSDTYVFNYKLAADPKATVHAGWTLGLASLVPTITEQVNKYYNLGIRQLIIMGHSQGGALAYLLRSYLYYQAQEGNFPKDIVVKTYCSAAPSPGNMYYAYDFDYINRDQWAFTILNALDWVPQTPVSVQTLKDFNDLNPFANIHKVLKKQSFLVRIYGKHVYNQLSHPLNRSQRRFEKYLGRKVYRQVHKYQPQFVQPHYAHTNDYVHAGTLIVLQPDSSYLKAYPDKGNDIFLYHMFKPYYDLAKSIYKK